MKICNCGEVIYTFPGKDYTICPKCNEVMHIIRNENNGSKNERGSSRKGAEGPKLMGFPR